MKRFLWLGFALFAYLICTGCGDTFRPIIIPNPPIFPNPRAAHSVLSINYNSACLDTACDNGIVPLPGSALSIDVSGDTEASIANVGTAPVFAAQQSANQVLVVSQAVTGLTPPVSGCSVTVGVQIFNVCPSLTQLAFNSTSISSTSSISLPVNSAPNFVAVAPASTTAYVTLPNLNQVVVITTTTGTQVATIPVGSNADALAVTPDDTKLYVANEGDSTISAFNTLDRSVRVVSPAHTASPPIWLAARTDSQQVYVLEQDGMLAWISTTSTAGPDTLTETSIGASGAKKFTYDSNLNRLYIPGGSMVVIVDVSGAAPTLIATIPIAPVAPAIRGAGDPCASTSVAALSTVDVAALPNGSSAYAGSYYEAASGGVNYICPQATMIDAVSNTGTPPIAIPGVAAFDTFCSPSSSGTYAPPPRFRVMMAAGGDSSRVYLSTCDGGNINIIDTSSQSYLVDLPAPVGNRSPPQGTTLNPPQNPVFMLAGP